MERYEKDNIKNAKPWKKQVYRVIKGKFTDKFFPPNQYSLLGFNQVNLFSDKNRGKQNAKEICDDYEWLRLGEIYKDPKLFNESITKDDVRQGRLGNCFFLAVIAGVAQYPNLIYRLFKTSTFNKEGKYEITLFIDGEWQVVTVDDYVPCIKGTQFPAFHFTRGEELWVPLIAKAFAKILASYSNSNGGCCDEPFNVLTGCTAEYMKIEQLKPKLFEIMKTGIAKGSFFFCGSSGSDSDVDNGLVRGHAYTVIDAFDVLNKAGDRVEVVTLRNPWGRVEWTGTWSEREISIDDELDTREGIRYAKAGTFNLPFEEFCEGYSLIMCSHFRNDSKFKSFKHSNPADLIEPQVYNLEVEQDGEFSIALYTQNERFNREFEGQNYPMQLLIASYDDNYMLRKVEYMEPDIRPSIIQGNIELKKGKYAIWFFLDYNDMPIHKKKECILRIGSPSPYKAIYSGPDPEFRLVKAIFTADVVSEHRSLIEHSAGGTVDIAESNVDGTDLTMVTLVNSSDKFSLVELIFTAETVRFWTQKELLHTQMIMPPNSAEVILGVKKVYHAPSKFNLINIKKLLTEEEVKKMFESPKENPKNTIWLEGNTPIKAENKPPSKKQASEFRYIAKLLKQDFPFKMTYDFVEISKEMMEKDISFPKSAPYEPFIKNLQRLHPQFVPVFKQNTSKFNDNGFYVLTLPDKSNYFGQCYGAGMPDGFGLMITYGIKIIVYMGKFKFGKKHDETALITDITGNFLFRGGMVKGVKHSKCQEMLDNNYVFNGSYEKGVRNGEASIKNNLNGDIWLVEFIQGELFPSAKYKAPNNPEKIVIVSELPKELLELLKN